MKKIIKSSILAVALSLGMVGCDFFDEMPGVQLDLDDTFSNYTKTEQFLNNIYSYTADDNTGERFYTSYSDRYGGIWMAGSIEANWSWDWHNSHKWNLSQTSPSSDYVTFWYDHFYQGINKASIFIERVDGNPELSETEKRVWNGSGPRPACALLFPSVPSLRPDRHPRRIARRYGCRAGYAAQGPQHGGTNA